MIKQISLQIYEIEICEWAVLFWRLYTKVLPSNGLAVIQLEYLTVGGDMEAKITASLQLLKNNLQVIFNNLWYPIISDSQ